MIIEAMLYGAASALSFYLGYVISRRKHMATPEKISETFRSVIASMRANLEREKANAVAHAVAIEGARIREEITAQVREEVFREFDRVLAEMQAAGEEFQHSGN